MENSEGWTAGGIFIKGQGLEHKEKDLKLIIFELIRLRVDFNKTWVLFCKNLRVDRYIESVERI